MFMCADLKKSCSLKSFLKKNTSNVERAASFHSHIRYFQQNDILETIDYKGLDYGTEMLKFDHTIDTRGESVRRGRDHNNI